MPDNVRPAPTRKKAAEATLTVSPNPCIATRPVTFRADVGAKGDKLSLRLAGHTVPVSAGFTGDLFTIDLLEGEYEAELLDDGDVVATDTVSVTVD